VDVPASSSNDDAFVYTPGAAPLLTGRADEDALVLPVTESTTDSAQSASDIAAESVDDSTIPWLTLSTSTGLLADSTPEGITSASTTLKSKLSGVASWADSNANKTFDDGYKDDCTDFVSRALFYGGHFRMEVPPFWVSPLIAYFSTSYWYHVATKYPYYTQTWSLAPNNAEWQLGQGSSKVGNVSDATPGDVVYVNWTGKTSVSKINHAGIIVRVVGRNLYIAQHTKNQVDSLYSAGSGYTSWMVSDPRLVLMIVRPGEN
jgi:hypothetical protein